MHHRPAFLAGTGQFYDADRGHSLSGNLLEFGENTIRIEGACFSFTGGALLLCGSGEEPAAAGNDRHGHAGRKANRDCQRENDDLRDFPARHVISPHLKPGRANLTGAFHSIKLGLVSSP